MVRSWGAPVRANLRVVVATASGKALRDGGRCQRFQRRLSVVLAAPVDRETRAVEVLDRRCRGAGSRSLGRTTAPRRLTPAKPADAAAADAIDAVRAVADVAVQAIRRRRTDAVVEMNVLTNYCVAAFRDEPRVLPMNSSS